MQKIFLWKCFDKKKNYLFAVTELGAKHICVIQSLIVTCRLQGSSPAVHLADAL